MNQNYLAISGLLLLYFCKAYHFWGRYRINILMSYIFYIQFVLVPKKRVFLLLEFKLGFTVKMCKSILGSIYNPTSPKFKVGVLRPIQQPGLYWDRSVLPVMGVELHTKVPKSPRCLV